MCRKIGLWFIGAAWGSLSTNVVFALVIANYSQDPAAYNRFASGYPTSPVASTDPSFVGYGYDWSGVGWLSTDPNHSFALLGPRHYLYANHYPAALGASIDFTPANGQVKSYTVQALSGPINGDDLAVGTFSAPIPASDNVHPYSIYFLGYSTNPITSPYLNLNLLVYGWTALTATNQITQVTVPPGYSDYHFYFPYSGANGQAGLESGDSGSPSFVTSGVAGQMYLVGDHHLKSQNNNDGYDTAVPLGLSYISGYMAQIGYLPYVTTPISATWKGTSSGDWGNRNNWSPRTVPVDGFTNGQVTTCASVLFDATATQTFAINIANAAGVTGVTFAAAGGTSAFTLAGTGTLTVGEAGVINNDNVSQTFNCPIALRASQRWSVGSGGLTIAGPVDSGAGNLLLVEGAGDTSVSGLITGSGSLAKDGIGTLTLASTSGNAYLGKTFIHGGTVAVSQDDHLGTAPTSFVPDQLTIDGGALEAIGSFSLATNRGITLGSGGGVIVVDSGQTLAADASIAGAGASLTKVGDGSLTLAASNSYTGSTTVSAGTLQLGDGAGNNGSVAGDILNNATLAFANPFAQTYAGNISGNGSLIKSATGTLALLGSNTYSGNTTVGAGTLKALFISSGGSTMVADNATLQVNYIQQHELTIGAGSLVVLGGVSAPAAAAPVGSSIAGGYEVGSAGGALAAVPEPGTLALLVSATLCLLPLVRLKRFVSATNAK